MSIGLMVCFARSGGTILNQCLGVMPRVVMLSEVNPIGGGWGARGEDSYTTPAEQARNWYGINIESSNYLNEIKELYHYCEDRGLKLIIRDWSYINFGVNHYYDIHSPIGRLLNYELLSNNFEINSFAFVRNPIDVLLSMGEVENNSKYLLSYIREVISLGIDVFKYEEFCDNTDHTLKSICRELGVSFNKNYNIDRINNANINGDVQQVNNRVFEGVDIVKKDRKKISCNCKYRIMNNESIREACRLLGYRESLFDSKVEKLRVYFDKYFVKYLSN